MAREFELKFELTPEQMAGFESSKSMSELRGSDSVDEVRSVYFDTRKHKLRRRGMSLRVRYVGEKRVQTLKVTQSGAFERNEAECELDSDAPDLSLVTGRAREYLRLKRLESKLVPVFETRVVRRTIPVQWGGSEKHSTKGA